MNLPQLHTRLRRSLASAREWHYPAMQTTQVSSISNTPRRNRLKVSRGVDAVFCHDGLGRQDDFVGPDTCMIRDQPESFQ
jgi:hypothetical protein